MKNYKISIIIPVYNVEKYIDRAMKSLLDQTIGFENLQVIFVDDCSTDKSWDIVCEFKNKHENVFAYRLSKNSGSPGAPRNKGLEFVKAKYVMLLDPDDMYCQNACEVLYNAIENNDVDFATGKFLHFHENENEICLEDWEDEIYKKAREKVYDLRNLNEIELRILIGAAWRSIFKTELIKKYHIEFTPTIFEDVKFLTDYLMKSNKGMYIDYCVYYYYPEREDSCSNKLSKKMFVDLSKVLKISLNKFKEGGCEIYFRYFFYWVIDDVFFKLIDCKLSDFDIICILKEFRWLFIYQEENKWQLDSESCILAKFVIQEDYDYALHLLKKVFVKTRKYMLELVDTKNWFLQQIKYKDERISELENWIKELEKAKKWLEEQVDFKDAKINELETILKDLSK